MIIGKHRLALMKIVRRPDRRCWHDAGTHIRCFDRCHASLILQNAVHDQIGIAENRDAQAIEDVGLQDDVGDSRLIFDTQKYEALGGSRLLTADDGSGDPDKAAVSHVLYVRGGNHLHAIQMLAVESHRMSADRQALVREVRLQTFDGIHWRERRRSFRRTRWFEQLANGT